MEEREFTHPGLRMVRDADGFRILLPVKTERWRRLLHALWFAVWMAGEAALVAALLGWQPVALPPRPLLIAFLAAFTAAGGFMLYRFLWYATGREIFVATRDMLTVRREILGIGRPRGFEREKIRSLRARRLRYRVVYPSWGRRFIGHGEWEIAVDTDDGSHAYARGLDEDEARNLAGLLRQEAHVAGRGRRPSEIHAG